MHCPYFTPYSDIVSRQNPFPTSIRPLDSLHTNPVSQSNLSLEGPFSEAGNINESRLIPNNAHPLSFEDAIFVVKSSDVELTALDCYPAIKGQKNVVRCHLFHSLVRAHKKEVRAELGQFFTFRESFLDYCHQKQPPSFHADTHVYVGKERKKGSERKKDLKFLKRQL